MYNIREVIQSLVRKNKERINEIEVSLQDQKSLSPGEDAFLSGERFTLQQQNEVLEVALKKQTPVLA